MYASLIWFNPRWLKGASKEMSSHAAYLGLREVFFYSSVDFLQKCSSCPFYCRNCCLADVDFLKLFILLSFGHGQYLMLGVFVEAVQCHMPANGESVTISTVPTVPVDVSLSLLKRTMSDTGELTDCFLICL